MQMDFRIINIIPVSLFLIISLYLSGCEKFVEVNAPVTGTNVDNVYTNDATAAAVLTGIYTNMSRDNFSALLSIVPGLTADELELFATDNADYYACYTNSLTPELGLTDFWSRLYHIIFSANDAIEGLEKSNSLSPAVKQQLIGEAKFIRAFMYFHLVNYYGDVPLATSTDYKVNSSLSRSVKSKVYEQIIKDLLDAKSLLNNDYVEANSVSTKSTTERVRPNKWAAIALLSRAYLYNSDFVNSEAQATEIINNTNMYELLPLNDVFLKNSRESIWQLQVVGVDFGANTEEGRVFVLDLDGPKSSNPVYLTNLLVNSFDSRDQRKNNWIGSVTVSGTTYNYPNKYKIGVGISTSAEYPMMLRLGEQYLIRAEAKIQLGKTAEGIADLNIIRKRATDLNVPMVDQLPQLSTSLSQSAALSAIENERKYELFTEFGNRWLDLRRFGHADAILSLIKGSEWQPTDQLFPIPQYDMGKNPSLKGHQNPGYN